MRRNEASERKKCMKYDLRSLVAQYVDLSGCHMKQEELQRLWDVLKVIDQVAGKERTKRKSYRLSNPYKGACIMTEEFTYRLVYDGRLYISGWLRRWSDDGDVRNEEPLLYTTGREIIEHLDDVAPGLCAPPLYLSANELAIMVGSDGADVNLRLRDLGYLEGSPNHWNPTSEGLRFCEVRYEYRKAICYWDINVAYKIGNPDACLENLNLHRRENGRFVFENWYDYFR